MALITLDQQDAIIERLSKATAIIECLNIASNPSAQFNPSFEVIADTLWAVTDLIDEAKKIATNKGGK